MTEEVVCPQCGSISHPKELSSTGGNCAGCLMEFGLKFDRDSPCLPEGFVVGHYEVKNLIGRGGMAEVYLAWDQSLHRSVALKVLPAEFYHDPVRRTRLLREARAIAALNHPNICTIHEIVEDCELVCLVMEYIEGGPLNPGRPGTDAGRVMRDVLEGLEAAHARGIVHRDLKPSNILISSNGRPKITDFGLAKLLEEEECPTPADSEQTTLTGFGQVLGSPPYMSPEQIKGTTVDGRSDLFSAGILLWELVTGARPFGGETPAEVASSILKDTPALSLPESSTLQPALRAVLERALAKDPGQRYQSAAEMKAAVSEAFSGSGFAVSRRNRKFLWGGAGALAFLAAILYFGGPWWKPVEAPTPAADSDWGNLPPDELLLEQGRLLTQKFSLSDNQQAIRVLERALRIHPDSAEAHALLALARLKQFWWYQTETELLEQALTAAGQALQFDPMQTEARVVRAIAATLRGPAPDSYRTLSQIARRHSDQLEANSWLAYNFFSKAGKFREAEALLSRLEKTPSNPYSEIVGAFNSIQKGEISEALVRMRRLQVLSPDSDTPAFLWSLAAIRSGNLPMLENALEQWEVLSPGKPGMKVFLDYHRVARGEVSELDLPTDLVSSDYEEAAIYAQILARLGENDPALEWLEHSVERGNYNLVQMDHPDFEALRDEPRFVALKTALQEKIESLGRDLEQDLFSK